MLTQATIRLPTSRQNLPSASAPAGTIDMIGAVMPFARNAEIYGENDRVEYLYRVLKGSVRTCKVLRDGRRQIAGFYLPGDVFGFEAGDQPLCRPRRSPSANSSCYSRASGRGAGRS